MQSKTTRLAPGFNLFPNLKSPPKTFFFHQIFVLVLTFLAYASLHASRKPPSIVKSVLGPKVESNSTSTTETGWAPFNGPHGTHRLGEVDLAFLTSYAVGMYFAGHAADRIDLRLFLVFGMLGSGLFTIIFGLGYWFHVHVLAYFIGVQIVCGIFQSIGWPCVVSVVGNWFGKEKRGLIMGVWTSHTSVGNIIGSVVASGVLDFGWGWSFLVPGVLVIVVAVSVFCFLVVSPDDLGFEMMSCKKEIEMNVEGESVVSSEKVEQKEAGLLKREDSNSFAAIGFLEAWKLPGVAPFACCLFFSKFVAYTFMYWLPFYIRHTAVAGVHFSHKTSGILSTIFDVGALILYRVFGSVSMVTNNVLMFLSGLLVNGPYSLITTAVAADLGTQDLIKGNSRALATVTSIIDGTGSVGAALGPLLAGYLSTTGWNSVFFMLTFAIFLASLFLIRIAKTEIARISIRGNGFGVV
ncbi:hypothetical protein V6N13_058260 [Hibiscus sabdariffa]|uniref:Major facilitator superfamily (MFS) profile domain-containing protein n=1 Tax=Hibiscus sabdariffa TaxID=183260 RepID=A0ABR2GGY9_9ROSI